MQNAIPNEVTLHPMLWRHSNDICISVFLLYIDFKRAHAVGCCKSMAINEEFPIQFLDGEAPFFMKVSMLGCHEKVLEGLWGHTQSFG